MVYALKNVSPTKSSKVQKCKKRVRRENVPRIGFWYKREVIAMEDHSSVIDSVQVTSSLLQVRTLLKQS